MELNPRLPSLSSVKNLICERTLVITQKIWMSATTIILIAIIVVAGLQIWSQTPKNILATAPLDESCDLQSGPCESQIPGKGKVSLSIAPSPIVGLKPLQLKVQTEGMEAETVDVDFRGIGMNMGFNRPRLQQAANGEFTGTGTLSVCLLDRMTWEATVLVTTGDGVLAAPFRFETIRR